MNHQSQNYIQDDDDDFDVKPVVNQAQPTLANAWDDEDEDNGAPVTESWEDFDQPKEETTKKASTGPAVKPSFSQVSGKKKRGKALAEKIRQKEAQEDEQPRILTYEEKKKLQKQIEASDLENAKDLFTVKESESESLFGEKSEQASGSKPAPSSFDNFKPKSEQEYIKFAELTNQKVEPFSGSAFYVTFLKEFLKKATTPMEAEDVKDLVATLNLIVNEKIKASSAKKGKKGKKKAPTKTTAAAFEDMVDDEYDMFAA